MSRMTVYPAEGRVVPDPEAGGNLPPEGREVPRDTYWLRRLQDQDVTTDAPKKAKATPKTPALAEPGSIE
jgi:hypothetical protein